MAEEEKQEECKSGAPAWMVTFSDLMTLLLTFFVLLLSMSTMETTRVKKGTASIREAFTGRLIVSEPYSEFVPVPSPVQLQKILRSRKPESSGKETEKFEKMSKEIQAAIAKEVVEGTVKMEQRNERILIELPEKTTFPSGSDAIKPSMIPILEKIADVMKDQNVSIIIAGHTDNVPIGNSHFRSNWDLSAERAVSVAHIMLKDGHLIPQQVEVVGHADAHPVVPNDSPENRARNRRVEILIDRNQFVEKPNFFQRELTPKQKREQAAQNQKDQEAASNNSSETPQNEPDNQNLNIQEMKKWKERINKSKKK